jgi:hypothetical protein
MEPMRLGETVMVSRYWTPDHIDVTAAPMTYARPKALWIEQLDKRRRFEALDEEPAADEVRIPFFGNLRAMTNAFMGRRLAK